MGKVCLRLAGIAAGLAMLGTLPELAAAQSTTPKKGGTAVVAVGFDPTVLNPTLSRGSSEVVAGCMIYEGLVVYNVATDKPEPALAESWTISPDGKTYTFKLRKTEWHDGKPFTSEDVRYTLMEVAATLTPSFSSQAGKLLAAVETPDPQTAILKLKEPSGPLLRSFSCGIGFAILPSHLYKGTDPLRNPVSQKAVGTGPFKYSTSMPGDRIVMVRNDKYWDQPKPYLDGIVIKVIPNAASRTQAVLAGEVDFVQFTYFPASGAEPVRASPNAKMELAASSPNTMHGFFNLKRKPFDDVRVRHALLVATDRKYIFDNVFLGSGRTARAPWASQLAWSANPEIDYDKSHPFDPEKAGRMLEEAGYKADASGVRFKVEITYNATASERNKAALAIQAMWKRAGVEVTIVPLENAVLLPRVHKEGNFDFYITSYNTNGDPAIGVAPAYTSSAIGAILGNASHYSNPEVDALFDKAAMLTNVEERAAIYRQIQPILMRDLPAISLHENRGWDAASKKLKDAWGYAGQGFWATAWLDR